MGKEHFVVIGNGPAGREAAFTLRQKLPESRISIISKENFGCYHPHLLPDFISGTISEDKLYACPPALYKERNIKLRLGQKVIDINFDRHEITLDHKEIISFSGLIIAVGGRPRIPEPLHGFEEHMLSLKTLNNAKQWITRLEEAESVLIVGGDLTSLAMSRALLRMRKKIFFMLNEDAFWPIRCDARTFSDVGQKLSNSGIEVLEGHRLKSISRLSENLYKVLFEEQSLEINIVGAFFGLVPDVQFLAGSGLNIERGILVNEYLNTGFEGVYAVGDCAQVYHPALRDYWISIGYDNAVNLGKIAGLNLAGDMVEATVAPESIFCDEGVRANTSWWTDF